MKSRFLPRFGGGGGGSWWFALTRWTKLKSASGSVGVGLVSMLLTMQSPSGDCDPGVDRIICLISKNFYLHTLHLSFAAVGNINATPIYQSPSNIVDIRIRQFKVDKVDVVYALNLLADTYRIPIGIICIDREINNDDPSISINGTNMPVSAILDEIIKQAPEYRWVMKDGVVNVYPKTGVDAFFNDILNVRFNTFVIEKDSLRLEVRKNLLDHTSVKDIILKHNMRSILLQFGCGFQSCFVGGNRDYSAVLNNMTMMQILNHLIRDSGAFFWNSYKKGNYFSIVF